MVYADYTREILKEAIGFGRKTFRVQESYETAREMITKYREFAAKYRVHY